MADELIRPLLEQVEVAVEVAVDAPSLLGRETPDGEAQREAMASFLAEGLTARVDLTQARLLEPLKLHSSLDADATKPHVKPKFGRLLLLAAPEAGWIAAGLLALTLRLPFNLAMPHFISTALAATLEISHSGDMAGLGKVESCVRGFFVAALFNAALDFFNWNFFVVAQQRMIRRLRKQVLSAILAQEMAFFDEQSTGDLISRLSADVGEMANDLTWVFRWSLEAVVRVTGISLYLFYVSWRLALLAWLVAPLVAVVNRVYGDFVQRNSRKTQTAIAEANEVAHEAISCIRTVFSFAQEPYEQARYDEKVQRYYDLSLRQGLLDGIYFMGISCFLMQTVLQGATLVGGVYLVIHRQMDGDHLIACMFYQSQLMEYMNNLLNVVTNLYKSSGAAAKVFELMDRVPRSPGTAGVAPTSTRAEGRVELRKVHFAYPTRPEAPILDGVSFAVQPGQVVALVGGSGAGKSTCFHLLENFYRPTSGQVLLDGMAVETLDHRWLHQAVGLVAQEPVLFRGSIAANIRYSRAAGTHADDATAEVEAAARVANAHGFVSALPGGYSTQVGERGVQLSGGQKQRIAIARALLQDCSVLLLDEATSALDAESEALVQAALEKAMVGRSVLVIAHRLSTVMGADLIVVLQSGRVVQRGTHAQLMSSTSAAGGVTTYRSLVARQTRETRD